MKRYVLTVLALGLVLTASAQEHRSFSLEECRALALENNNDIRNAALDEVAAKAKKNEVFTNFFPQVNGLGVAMHSLDYQLKFKVGDIFGKSEYSQLFEDLWTEIAKATGAKVSPFNFLKYAQFYNVSAVQPVFMGGQIITGNKYAALGIQAASLKKSITTRDVLQSVDDAYFKVTALQEKQKTLNALQTLLDTLGRIADVAFGEGMILKSDHMLLETKRMELQNGRVKLNSGMRLLKMNLLSTVGISYKVLDLDSFSFPGMTVQDFPSPSQVYVDEEKVAAETEESRLLDLQVQAKEYERKLTLGSTLPQLGLGFGYGWKRLFETNDGQWNGMTFAVLRVPISDWAKNSFKMQQQKVAIDKAVNDRNHLKEMLVLQQRKLYLELTSAWDAMQLARSQKEYSEYLYEQSKLNYESGHVTVGDLLQSYSSLSEVQERWCNSVSDYLTALHAYTSRLH